MATGIRKRTGNAPKSPWTDAKKVEVVTTYLALGKAPMVEAVTGVPRGTIRQWKLLPWWDELVKQIQSEEDQELDAKLTKLINKSIDGINDRLENGEFVLDSRTGKIKRVPVKLRDVQRVASDFIDKRFVVRDKPRAQAQAEVEADRLIKLAEQFAQFAQAISGKNQEKVIEGEVIDAVHEERETGLQTGGEGVHEPTGSDSEAGEAECCEAGSDGRGASQEGGR